MSDGQGWQPIMAPRCPAFPNIFASYLSRSAVPIHGSHHPNRHATEDSCTAVDLRLFLKRCTPALIMGTHVGGALFFVGGDTPRVIPHGVEVG